MEMFKAFIFIFALLGFALVLAHAQDQTDFISLDCGLPRNESYSEPSTGLNYISDAPFIKTGVSKTIAPEYKAFTQEQVAYLRSFPEGIRNCYTIKVTKETRYLIRATFFHGNYDGQNIAPKFDLHFGASLWDTVEFFNVSVNTIKEIIHVSLQDYVRVCLVNTGSGTPFISALELRPLLNNTYVIPSGSLALSMRVDMGRSINDIRVYRYPFDVFDRLWLPFNNDNEWKKLTTSLDMSSGENYKLPSVVMKTASTPMNGSTRMDIYWDTSKKDLIGKEFYMYMHFAELQELKTNQSRAFNITFNGKLWYNSPVVTMSSQVTTISSLSSSISTDNGKYNYSLIKLENSTLPPLINALEIYSLVDFSQSETDQDEVAAIANIKLNYGVKRNWDGDPCVPVSYMWEGLNCSNDGFGLPKITSLNLSSSGLTGEITSYLSKLTMIVSLDLSNNSLTGSVPGFLSQLPKLKVLNLERNKLTGSVPVELIERSKNGLLYLSVGQNPNLCASLSCKKKKNSLLIPILASSGGVVILLIAVAFLVGLITNKRGSRNNQKDPFESKKRQFTHSELIKITNNFEKKLGEGGGGEVYRGSIDASTNVAVKIIRRPLVQGNNQLSQDEKMKKEKAEKEAYQLFQAEVQLLMTVYHRNLTSLVGYCYEGSNMALVYEFMENGDLRDYLSGKKADALSWKTRLEIAIDAAQGLEYMHNGCVPPIIHRDVKPENILLTKNFRAKLGDFGLSRFFSNDGVSHVLVSCCAGTIGYLAPEAVDTDCLDQKSDVYSFGVVLLQIITGQPTSNGNKHLKDWVRSIYANGYGDVTSIIDQRLQGDFDINTIKDAVDIAIECVSETLTDRPDMSKVVATLKNCLAAELAAGNYNYSVSESTNSSKVFYENSTTEVIPLAKQS